MDDENNNTFRGWEVYEVLPMGWKIDTSCGSPLHGFDFCTDGKSVLNGGKRALVRTVRKGTPSIQFIEPVKKTLQPTVETVGCGKTILSMLAIWFEKGEHKGKPCRFGELAGLE